MTTFERAAELFHELCDLDEDAQEKRLAEIARLDPEVHAQLYALLADDRQADPRLERAALDHLSTGGEHSFFRRTHTHLPDPAPGLAPEKQVGDYRLIVLLGQGGMGQVWEAEQLSMKRRVALKFLRPGEVTEKQLELFAREARAGGRLSHPGIVAVYGHGESDGLAWIAMELVSGAWTLRDFLDEAARMETLPASHDHEAARLVAEIADAMQVAHEARVIHRDLKPQNVLITSDEHPKVTDFGLARITDESALTRSGELAGTYYYMSPEQVAARHAGIDHRTDVFSLGIVLYEMLALRRPFEGDTSHQVAAQIVTKDPPDIRTIRSKVPRDLAVIANHALEKDRDKRYPTMKEFAADLRRHLANEPIHATPPTQVDRTVKWVKRNPTKSTAAAIAAAAFVTITLLLVENVRARNELSAKTTEALTSAAEARENARVAHANEQRATGEKERADREAEAATKQADEVLRLSALQKLEDLTAEADRLWPAVPENLPRYEEWLRKARELVAELPGHEKKLAELRSKSVLWTEEEQAKRPQLAEIEDEVSRRQEWNFADAQDKWWHNQLEKLVEGLKTFSDSETGLASITSAKNGWGVEKRAEFARSIAERSVSGSEASKKWAEAIASIANAAVCPPYGGLRITPQLGLLPIGRDPESGLWEFAHLQTGERAERGSDGRLILEEETGLVFVLLPGGTFTMGAQRSDPNGPNYDPQANSDETSHVVMLSPFFLSKHEMTQGQWLRFVGRNPSQFGPDDYSPDWNRWGRKADLVHPVESVSWDDCTVVLERLGLALPSEAQWEYGARADTTTIWWTGNEKQALADADNVSDSYANAHGGEVWGNHELDIDDGNAVHARVGSYRPNPFGLHDAIGNVCEWCRDGYQQDFYCQAPKEDPVSDPGGTSARVYRGGSFGHPASIARSAYRNNGSPSSAGYDLGCRPAKALLTP